MHDIADLDARGIPGGFVASTEFIQAVDAQSASLGFDAAVVYVPHPIQDRTDEEMNVLASDSLNNLLRLIVTTKE